MLDKKPPLIFTVGKKIVDWVYPNIKTVGELSQGPVVYVANHCQLTSLDCSNNLKLSKLHVQGNPLTELILAEGQYISDLKVDNHDIIVRK
jgi:hypothetical protein